MKFNIAVEIDWIGEEGNIDEVIKKEITSRVVDTVCKKIDKEMEVKAAEAINEKVDDMCDNLIQEFLKRKITVTDEWGKEILVDTTIEDIIKKKLQEFWSVPVDESGRSGRDGYGDKKTRIEWAINNLIQKSANSFTKAVTEDTNKKIKETMTESLKAAVGAKIVGEIGIKNLLLESRS